MFISILRAAVAAIVGTLIGSVMVFVISQFLPLLGPEDTIVYAAFENLGTILIMIILLAVGISLVYRAVVERTVGI